MIFIFVFLTFGYLQNDFDIMDYLNELRECCLEAYTGIVQGLKGEDKETIGTDVQLILPHVPHMINFITTIARDREKSDGTISAAAGLIGYKIVFVVVGTN